MIEAVRWIYEIEDELHKKHYRSWYVEAREVWPGAVRALVEVY
jgi:hypothetical protein